MIDTVRERFRTRFIDTARARVRRCLELLGQEDCARSLEHELHALAGEAAILGLGAISDAAREGEHAARKWAAGEVECKARCARAIRTVSRAVEAFAAEPAEQPAQPAGPAADKPDKYKVLVIDDSVLSGEHITDALIEAGIETQLACDQPSALAAVQTLAPDLVLSDVHMPGIVLFDLCQELRARAPAPILLILLSGMSDDELAACAGQVKADGYLSKQRGADHVVERLQLILRESRR